MSVKTKKINKVDHVVVRFAGDSGDGMQLTGNQFTSSTAIVGNDLITLPDYPAEIRAPQGTVAGVSGFQVHIGQTHIYRPVPCLVFQDFKFILVANQYLLRVTILMYWLP